MEVTANRGSFFVGAIHGTPPPGGGGSRRTDRGLRESPPYGPEGFGPGALELRQPPRRSGDRDFRTEQGPALLDNARELRRKVRAALRRIEEGAYGRCAACGSEIEPERLEALPCAEFCLACQKREESHDPPRLRPIEEEALHPPFGRSFRDRTSTVGYDGEDAWQDVARYGTAESPSDVGGAVSYDELYVDGDERRGAVEEVEKLTRATPEGEPY